MSLKTNVEIQKLLSGYRAKNVVEISEVDNFYRKEFEEKYATKVRFFEKKGESGQYYYDYNFVKFIFEKNSDSLYQILETSIIPTDNIEDTYALYIQRAGEGSKLILNGNEISELNKKRTSIEIDYLNKRINYLQELQSLGAFHTDIQQDFEDEFLSTEEIIEDITRKHNFQVHTREFEEIIQDYYLQSNSLQSINLSDYSFFFNYEFYFISLPQLFLKKRHSGNAQMNFRLGFPNRPLIFKVKKLNCPRKEKEIQELNKNWMIYKEEYERKKQDLDYQINIKDRGGWTLKETPDLFFEGGEWVFYQPSRYFEQMFNDLYHIVSTKSPPESEDKKPEYLLRLFFNQIAEFDYPPHFKEFSFEEFEAKMKQQYLYFSDNIKKVRFDLFRDLEPNENTFQGGLLHILARYKPFSDFYGNKRDNLELSSSKQLLDSIIQTALNGELDKSSIQKNGNYKLTLTSNFKEFDGKTRKYEIGMYYDVKKQLYFVNKFHRK